MKILIIDNGLFCSLAEALSDGGKNEVIFCTPWAKPFPTVHDYAIGHGYGHLKKKLYFFDHVKSADLIGTFDVSNNDLIHFLRQQFPQKSVFGCGLGERLENDRVIFKRWLEQFNLPVGPYKVIKGLSKLRDYLKTNGKKYIKTNIFRNEMESFYFDNYKDDKYLLDEKAVTLGMLAEEYTFIVEDLIESKCELGFDGFFSGGEYIPFSYGPEIAKNLYVGKVIRDIYELPDCMQNTLEAFRPLLTKMDYRGALSTEERIVSQEKSFFIDFCARVPAPLGQLYPVAIENWSDLVYRIGKKEVPEVECEYDYVGAFALSDEHAADHNVKLKVDPKHLNDVRFTTVAQNEDGYFAVKGNTTVCVLVAGGKSPTEVIQGLKKAKEYVDAYGIEKDSVDGIDKQFEEALAGMKSVGIEF